uniref:Rab-GAP TBC domain-containing protein n=1 Tax=Globisporangium ultimum (strain ATCC 200006 / CBS 805.95 / DAOM BR144) TaxID=431595 RepID=K3WBN5_GLOUD
MGRKKRNGNDPRRAKGIPGRLRAERERKEIEAKAQQLRAAVARIRSFHAAQQAADSQPSAIEGVSAAAIFQKLRRLAVHNRGFVSDTFRQEIWPFLVGYGGFEPLEVHDPGHFAARTGPHRDDYQVEKDIERSLWHYDIVKGIRESDRRAKRRALTQIINAVLRGNDELHYYQGYHDVSSVFLLALGDQRAFCALERVSSSYHREAMGTGFETVMQVTRLLFPLVDAEDSALFAYMCQSGVEPFFALPWMITWFAHQLQRFEDVTRLYDVFLVSHPLFCLYVSAALILEARVRILKCDCDFGTMHSLLSKLPQTMDVEKVIARATMLIHTISPAQLLQLSDADPSLAKSTYFNCPYAYQERFDMAKPYVTLPVVTKNLSRQNKMTKTSILVRAAAVGIFAAALSYAYRNRIQPV